MTNQTFEQLKKTYESGRTRPLAWRRAQLNALRRLVTENRDAFVSSAMADLGKPAAETVLMELNLVAGEAQFVRNRLSLWTARHPKAMHWMLQPAAGWTIAEPKGVVLIISPWNYPVLLALEPMADALAAGNAICLKPSELSPNTSRLIAELVPQYLDPEAVRVVEGGPKETGDLLKNPFNHIFYTGGGHVGKIVMRAAAEHLTPVTLELGGKSPCFVDRTADINVAARRIAWGKFTNAGQTCVAPDYVLATPDVAEALAERIADPVFVPFGEVPGMGVSTANGHVGRFVAGMLGGKRVLAMQGRLHGYEGYTAQEVAFPVWLMARLGAGTLITTNAAGAINESYRVGDFCIMTDQLNFTGRNPITGTEPAAMAPRFFSMLDAYDPALRQLARQTAEALAIPVQEGVYLGLLGPSFETPAEIQMFRSWGADTVAMSVCEEVIAARHVGMRVLGISLVSNMACGVEGASPSDEEVHEVAQTREADFCRLIEGVLLKI